MSAGAQPTIVIVHAWTSEGYETVASFDSIWDWLRSVLRDIEEWVKLGEESLSQRLGISTAFSALRLSMDFGQIERRLNVVLNAADGWLPAEQLADMRALVAAGEPGVALENFCTQLEELDVAIPRDVVNELMELATSMDITLSPWIGSRT